MKEYTNPFKEIHPWIWEDAIQLYCDEGNIDINDIYIPEHEDNIIKVGICMWEDENINCEHGWKDACYYCKMD